jgi:hypothetical protein
LENKKPDDIDDGNTTWCIPFKLLPGRCRWEKKLWCLVFWLYIPSLAVFQLVASPPYRLGFKTFV